MIDRTTAQANADAELRRMGFGSDVVIAEDATVEHAVGWVFFYNTREYLETENLDVFLVGAAPMIVERADGTVHQTLSGRPWSWDLANLEAAANAGAPDA